MHHLQKCNLTFPSIKRLRWDGFVANIQRVACFLGSPSAQQRAGMMNPKIAVAPPVPQPTTWMRMPWPPRAQHPPGEWGATDFWVQGKPASRTGRFLTKELWSNCDAVGRHKRNIFYRKRLYSSIAHESEAGFLISQISQQVIKFPLAEAMNATVQRPQLRNLG